MVKISISIESKLEADSALNYIQWQKEASLYLLRWQVDDRIV